MKKLYFLVIGCLWLTVTSCEEPQKVSAALEEERAKVTPSGNELELLSSQQELNFLLARSGGDEGIVDWELSREFAEMALEEFIEVGDFPASSTLWDIPIAIYNGEGEVRYYEFRVLDPKGVTIAAIACVAKEDMGTPIAYIFEFNGYSDTLDKLYAEGKLNDQELPRIIDNVYPSYAVGGVEVSRSGSLTINTIYDNETGKSIEADELNELVDFFTFAENNPDLVSDEQRAMGTQTINNFERETKELWKSAQANKGRLRNFAFKGRKKKSPRTRVDRINRKERGYDYRGIRLPLDEISYYWCGPTSVGYILNHLRFVHGKKMRTDITQRNGRRVLEKSIRSSFSGITWPWELTKPIRSVSGSYKTSLVFGITPKRSIEANIPGINLRMVKDSRGFHYRNVVGYKKKGWWIFRWTFLWIQDNNGVDTYGEPGKRVWETYIPFYHLMSWDVVKI